MSYRVKLTVAAANAVLRSIRWRSYSTEYQVMVRRERVNPTTGQIITFYEHGYSAPAHTYDHASRIWPQSSYRDALVEVGRLRPVDQPRAVIFRITTERPA